MNGTGYMIIPSGLLGKLSLDEFDIEIRRMEISLQWVNFHFFLYHNFNVRLGDGALVP